jgi:hypothetical protein
MMTVLFDDASFQTKRAVVDTMHGPDLGMGGLLIKHVFRIGFEGANKWRFVHGLGLQPQKEVQFRDKIDICFDAWKACLPDDFARKPRHPKWANDYKAREINVIVMRYFLAMWHAFGGEGEKNAEEYLDKGFFKNVMCFVTAMKILGSFSCKPLRKVFIINV